LTTTRSNCVLWALEQGQPLDQAVREMQVRGIAEADPSLDIDGWDAAAKTVALANVLLDGRLAPRDVERRGLTAESGRMAMAARAAGRRLKLVARARREGGRVAARVDCEELPADDLLAGVEG